MTKDEMDRAIELNAMNDQIEQQMYEDVPIEALPTLDELFALIPDVHSSAGLADAHTELEAIVTRQFEETKVRSTEYQERLAVGRFRQFLSVYNFANFDVDSCSVDELDRKLKYFYATLRKDDGAFYSPTTLICYRAGLFRYIMRVRKINIIECDAFHTSNLALKAVCRLFLKAGGRVQHYEAISKDDMCKLSAYFDRSNATTLMHEVYFALVYYFGQRGREWLRGLQLDSLIFENVGGVETVKIKLGLQKTLGTKLSASSMDDNREAVMKATGVRGCPVSALKLYMDKHRQSTGLRNGNPSIEEGTLPFFLKPCTAKAAMCWFTTKPIGVNTLTSMMKTMSEAAGLSKAYTPHNIRPTVISELHESGFRLEQICKVTGHKDVKTVQR